jgi:hypothetical protein
MFLLVSNKAGSHTQLADHAVQGLVLLVIVLQGEDGDENGENLLERDSLTVSENHTAETSSSVVLKARDLHLQTGLQPGKDGRVLLDDLSVCGGVLDKTANSIGRIGLGLRILIAQAVNEELQERTSELSDTSPHTVDALGKDSNGGGTLQSLSATSVAQDGLLKYLPEFGEAPAQSSSETGNDVKGSVNNNPIELRRLLTGLERLLFGAKLELARVLLRDDVGDHLDDVVESGLVGNQRRTAVAQVLSHVTVDIGDSSPMSSGQ